MEQRIRIALLGFGTVGRGVYDLIYGGSGHDEYLEIAGIAVRDLEAERGVDPRLLTNDPLALVARQDIDLVIEVMGGLEPAGQAIRQALERGVPVVTANKELIAKQGDELTMIALGTGTALRYEAAVGGGVPMVQMVAESLAATRIERIEAVLNGTSNFILNRMAESGTSFALALNEAQNLGYAEADPTSDVDGYDTMYKLAILTAQATGLWTDLETVRREGIRGVSAETMQAAKSRGEVMRLVARADLTGEEPVLTVGPEAVPVDHPLHRLPGAMNGLLITADPVGSVFLSGPGAGAGPTATAVMADVLAIAPYLQENE
jgi:homoserine dehydrogenase